MGEQPNCIDGLYWNTDNVYSFIERKLVNGGIVTVNSGAIHKEIGLINRQPMVCGAMKKLRNKYDNVVIKTPNNEQWHGSTLIIEYHS